VLFDLVVDSIIVPPGLRAPCPTTILVVVRNLGPDPAPYPFDVCLQIAAFAEEPFLPQFSQRVDSPERGGGLGVNQTVTVRFSNLAIPCRPQAWLAAEVDCNLLLPKFQAGPPPSGHQRSNPGSGIIVPVHLVPWLTTDLEVGQQASSGVITWGATPLCPNLPVVAKVSVTNIGCADAPSSDTRLTVTGSSGVTSVTSSTGKIPPTKTVTFLQPLPTPAPPTLKVEACADTAGVVTGQCDTSGLCRSLFISVSAMGSGAPFPLLDDAAVLPGQQPVTNWSLANDCSDLEKVSATIISGGSTLYTSAPQAVTPLGRAGEEQVTFKPPASLWTIGQHPMELHVTATGMPGKSWVHTAFLHVNGEFPRFRFTWTGPGTTPWKRVYFVSGTLTNSSSFSAMTPAGITITEATSTPGVTAEGTISVSPPAAPILPGGTAILSIPTRLQSWTWINPLTFQLAGPTAATFRYTVTFTLTDEFGNLYPAPSPTSMPVLTVMVAVPASKLAFQALAAKELAGAMAALAAAVGLASAAAIFAFALWGSAIWHKGQADDPPVPDFRYDEQVTVAPRRFDFPGDDTSAWTGPVATVVDLLERARVADEAMTLIHAKILGARVDRAAEALRMQIDDYRAALARLGGAIEHLPNAAALAAEAMRTDHRWDADQLAVDVDAWRSGRSVEEIRRLWLENGLGEDAFEDLARRMREAQDFTSMSGALVEISDLTTRLAEALTEQSNEFLSSSES
jgi:hypothetical protein